MIGGRIAALPLCVAAAAVAAHFSPLEAVEPPPVSKDMLGVEPISPSTLKLRLAASTIIAESYRLSGLKGSMELCAFSRVVHLEDDAALVSAYVRWRDVAPGPRGPRTSPVRILSVLVGCAKAADGGWACVYLRSQGEDYFPDAPWHHKQHRRLRKLATADPAGRVLLKAY